MKACIGPLGKLDCLFSKQKCFSWKPVLGAGHWWTFHFSYLQSPLIGVLWTDLLRSGSNSGIQASDNLWVSLLQARIPRVVGQRGRDVADLRRVLGLDLGLVQRSRLRQRRLSAEAARRGTEASKRGVLVFRASFAASCPLNQSTLPA